MAAFLFISSSHSQTVTSYGLYGLFGLSVDTVNGYVEKFWWANVARMLGLEAVFDPSIYITSASQRKPKVIILEENHVMFTRMVKNEELEEIIEEEVLRQVPIYFYDPLAPTDDFWPLSEGEEQQNKGEEPKEE